MRVPQRHSLKHMKYSVRILNDILRFSRFALFAVSWNMIMLNYRTIYVNYNIKNYIKDQHTGILEKCAKFD